MTFEHTAHARCLTCSGALPHSEPWFDADEGIMVAPAPYCSIHCEHYAALQRATMARASP